MVKLDHHAHCLAIFFTTVVLTASSFLKDGVVVYPEIFSSRAVDGFHVLKLSNGITLKLYKSSVLQSQFLLRTYTDGVPMHTYMTGEDLEEDLYHDEDAMASVTLNTLNGVTVEGIVGPKLRVAPLLSHERDALGRIPHHLVPIEGDQEHDENDYSVPEYRTAELRDTSYDNESMEVAERSSNTIYPELFVVVDSLFASSFSSTAKVIKYVCIMVNAMNLRYLSVTNPKVKHRLVGLEVTEPQKETFLRRLTLDSRFIHSQESLASFYNYIMENPALYKKFDIIYMLTAYDMATIKNGQVNSGNAGVAAKPSSHCAVISEMTASPSFAVVGLQRWWYMLPPQQRCIYVLNRAYVRKYSREVENFISGYAYIRTACTDLKVGIGEDKPITFRGVHVMAHEIGHMLGCLHDGERSPWESQGAPGSTECPFQQGFLMSYIRKNSNTYKFSECCIRQIRQKARAPSGACLHEKNTENSSIKKYSDLPGKKVDRTEQCRNAFPTLQDTYYMEEYGVKDCRIRCATRTNGRDSDFKTLNLCDGSPCKKMKNYMCINGMCLRSKKRYGVEAVPQSTFR